MLITSYKIKISPILNASISSNDNLIISKTAAHISKALQITLKATNLVVLSFNTSCNIVDTVSISN